MNCWKYFTTDSNFCTSGAQAAAMIAITNPATLPAITLPRLERPGLSAVTKSMVTSVAAELRIELSVEIIAATKPTTTTPLMPVGISSKTSVG